MSFLKRRSRSNGKDSLIPQSEDADNTYVARLAKEEADHDWRNKPRHEKVRLARLEMRRRKSEREGGILLRAVRSWTWEGLLIVGLALLGFVVLLWLLHHRSVTRRVTGREETWLETVEDVLGMT